MTVSSDQAVLNRAGRDFFVRWDQIKAIWRDENRARFEQELITPLRAELRKAQLAMTQMDALVNRARRDCR